MTTQNTTNRTKTKKILGGLLRVLKKFFQMFSLDKQSFRSAAYMRDTWSEQDQRQFEKFYNFDIIRNARNDRNNEK